MPKEFAKGAQKMDNGFSSPNSHKGEELLCDSTRRIIIHPLYLPKSVPWLNLKVFYVRLSNCEVDESTPEHLTIEHILLTPDTILEVNGRRSGMHSRRVSCLLRRDRIDKKSEEATFVSTDCIRMTGSVRFEVCVGDDMFLSGVLELVHCNGLNKEVKDHKKKWKMRCQPAAAAACCFLDGKIKSSEFHFPTIEVYIAGCSSGAPIILTKTIQLGCRKKQYNMKVMPDLSLEDGSKDSRKEFLVKDTLQGSGCEDPRSDNDMDNNYDTLHSGADYIKEEDGELSWFNAGVRVGVGISLGVCLGIGIGVGLLVRGYQATTRNFKRKLI